MQEQRRNSASPSGGRDGRSGRAGEVPDWHGKDRTEMSHRSAVRPGIKATKGRQNGVAASAVLALTKL